MTAGQEDLENGFRSYRGRLYQALRADGLDVDFIGTKTATPAVGGDPEHDGYGGAFVGPGGIANNLWDRLPSVLGPSVNPDIIIMAFGWNSVYNEPSEVARKYRGFVAEVQRLKPSAALVLGTLDPQRGETEQQSNNSVPGYRDLNAAARQLAQASSSDKLYLADLALAGYAYSDYWDVIHLLQPGADKAAQTIHAALIAGPLKP
jgi:GDSL-like Lipase/Acylhydrolase family